MYYIGGGGGGGGSNEAWIGSVRFGWKVRSRSPCNTRLTSWILGNARSLSVREERRPREAWTEADARVLPRGYGRPTITYSRVWLWYLTRNTVPRSRASPSLSLSRALSLLLSLPVHRADVETRISLRSAPTSAPALSAAAPPRRIVIIISRVLLNVRTGHDSDQLSPAGWTESSKRTGRA